MRERWKMNKLGFVNFWLYDWEEFPFYNGRLLLRGENGAGKSITTQSFIPFMLDGDIRPSRLDPFGSKDRHMEYYLLGEDREENTGYLYLEFIKSESALYRTLVVGMRARRGKPLDFWGFCLSDGRRVGLGEDEFALFTQKGSSQRIALTRQEAHNRFGDSENWVEKSSDYKRMVDRMLFGCGDLEQYDRLLKLFIQIRRPKLSKDFSQKMVCDTLNGSLQPLSNEDIAPLANSMQKMDDIQARLNALRSSLDAARQLRNEYIRYNSYVLGKKGRVYLEKHEKKDKLDLAVQDLEDEIEKLESNLSAAQTCRERAKQEQETLRQQIDALKGADDLKAKTDRLQSLAEERKEKQANVDREKEREQRKQSELQAKEREKDAQNRRVEEQKERRDRQWAELQELNAELRYPKHPKTLSEPALTMPDSELSAFQERLREAADLLEKEDEAREDLDELSRKQDEAGAALQHEQQELDHAEALVVQMRDALCEAIALLQDGTLPFHLTGEDERQLLRLVTDYADMVQEQAIGRIFNERKEALAAPLRTKLAVLQQEKTKAQEEINELKSQISSLQEQKELPPPRSEAVQATRSYLQQRSIPHAAFYELVDFDPTLPAPQRALLEAQLQDAGILDALVLRPDERQKAADLFTLHPDHFLCLDGQPAAGHPLPLRPEPDAPAWADVPALLQRLSALPQGAVYFSANGQYRQGVLQGYSVPQAQASYIGAGARKANRTRRLAELQALIEKKLAEQQLIGQEIEQTKGQLTRLEEAYRQRPTTDDLVGALVMAEKQREIRQRAEQAYEQCRLQVSRQQSKLDALRRRYLPLVRTLPYEHTADEYRRMADLCRQYRDQRQQLCQSLQTLEAQTSNLLSLEDTLDRINNDLLDCTDRVRRAEVDVRRITAAITALQQELDRPENQDLARRLRQLTDARKEAEAVYHRADNDMTACRTSLEIKMPELAERKEQQQSAFVEDERALKIFEEELRFGPGHPAPDGTSLLEQAGKAWNSVRINDRGSGITHESVRTSLAKNVGNAADLADYRISLDDMFESEEGMLRNRAVINLYPDGRRQDLLDFITSIESRIKADAQLLSDEDRRLFEMILNQTVTTKLRYRINDSQDWVDRMSVTLQDLVTSSGMQFMLEWKGKPADSGDELSTRDLVSLLRKDPAIMGDAERQKILAHFHARIQKARQLTRQEGNEATYYELMRDALDFRQWFEFKLYFQRPGQAKKELTNTAFNTFSGGEKAMAMYAPLFAALVSQYGVAAEDAPRMMALDEAFAGVDEANIESMFTLAHTLELGYIMNSQSLWGCYPSVDALSIVELFRPQGGEVVTLMRYRWDGKVRYLEEA